MPGGRVRVPQESPGEATSDGAAQFGGSLSIFEKVVTQEMSKIAVAAEWSQP